MTGWGVWASIGLGVCVAAGVLFIVAGLQPAVEKPREVRRSRRLPLPGVRAAAAGVAGVLLAALTGWVVWVLIVPLAVLVGPRLLGSPKNRDIELMQALDRWVRNLSATMATGRSVLDAIRVSRRSAPEYLREPVNRLVARLNDRWSNRDALTAFADELAGPDADAVVAALMLAAQRGQTGAGTTLNELSDSLQHRLRAWREIEAERAKPRFVVRQVTVVMAVVLAASLVLGGDFFSPYGTPLGQAILFGIVLAYLGSLLMLQRMTTPPTRERILTGRATQAESGVSR